MDFFQKINELQSRGMAAALITVVEARGSVPREAGAKMIVQHDGRIFGTIGGGAVEALVIEEAQQVIKNGRPRLVKHDLNDEEGSDTGMVCGGNMTFFIEPLAVTEKLYIFGGGHIALYLSRLAELMGWRYAVIDDREEFCNAERFPKAEQLYVEAPGKTAAQLTTGHSDYIIIITRDHAYDYDVLREVLKSNAGYIGMIGSKLKRKQIYEKLITVDGVSDDRLARVHSPIGLDIHAETPEEIALSIMAELVQVKRAGSMK